MEKASLTLRLEKDLREAFLSECRSRDCSASQTLRGFMRDFVEIRRPNELTRKTLLKSSRGEGVHKAGDLNDLFEQLRS
jgi:hypothetical protein